MANEVHGDVVWKGVDVAERAARHELRSITPKYCDGDRAKPD